VTATGVIASGSSIQLATTVHGAIKRRLAVSRSNPEPRARTPYPNVHVVDIPEFTPEALSGLSSVASRIDLPCIGDIDISPARGEALRKAAPGVDVWSLLTKALTATGVRGAAEEAYRSDLDDTLDFMHTWGARFHSDAHHWVESLFWVLVLHAPEVELVLPQAGICVPLMAGRLVVFDPVLGHGLRRIGDKVACAEESFRGTASARQTFLAGELQLNDDDWCALGSPWVSESSDAVLGATDLGLARYDPHTGAILNARAAKLKAAEPANSPA